MWHLNWFIKFYPSTNNSNFYPTFQTENSNHYNTLSTLRKSIIPKFTSSFSFRVIKMFNLLAFTALVYSIFTLGYHKTPSCRQVIKEDGVTRLLILFSCTSTWVSSKQAEAFLTEYVYSLSMWGQTICIFKWIRSGNGATAFWNSKTN